jgi:hypothetical protein
MLLKERITEDMKSAMRAKESVKLGTIRMLLAAVKQKEVDERIAVDDVTLVTIIDKLIKQRKDAVAAYEQAQRQDLADKEEAEIRILSAYLPQRLTQAEVLTAAQDIARRLGVKGPADMGKMMAVAKAELAGRADMGQVSLVIKQVLAG